VPAQGPYGIKFTAADESGAQLFCVDMAFTITPPHGGAAANALEAPAAASANAVDALRRAGTFLTGATRRVDPLAELRAAFAAMESTAELSAADASAVL
jgi:hypothetical protein